MAEEYISGMRKQPICDMTSQLADEARRFLVLSDQGLVFLNQQRPVDTLYNILAKHKSATYELDCRAFFNRYGSIEACAMCISIVCACNASNAPNSGTTPVYHVLCEKSLVNPRYFMHVEEIKQQALMVYVTLGGAPSPLGSLSLSYSNHLGQAIGQMNILYSSKHDGLVLYLARILRDAWKTNVFEIM
jgi:nuclear pore complex protein Nup155